MNKIWILIVVTWLLRFSSGSLLIGDDREVQAFAKVATSVLISAVSRYSTVLIAVAADDVNQTHFDDEIEAITKESNGKLSLTVYRFEDDIPANLNDLTTETCLLFFESFETYRWDYGSINIERQTTRNPLIIYFGRVVTADEILQLHNHQGTEYPIKPRIRYFIINSDRHFINLVAIKWYTREKCAQPQLVEINRFSKATFKWDEELTKLKVFEDFTGCTISLDLDSDAIRADVKSLANGTRHLTGFAVEILREIAKFYQFKPEFYYKGYANSDGKEIDFNTQFVRLERMISHENDSFYKEITQFIHKELFFIVPSGELYTDWEKLLLAFDTITWLLIVLTFFIAMTTIFIINFMPLYVQRFVFGRNVTTPSLNLFIAFIGLSQVVLPGRNFARFILALWIIWSLIFRTAYHGLLFEYLEGNGRKPEVKTIEEMMTKDFTYHVWGQNYAMVKEMDLIKR